MKRKRLLYKQPTWINQILHIYRDIIIRLHISKILLNEVNRKILMVKYTRFAVITDNIDGE